MPERSPDPVVQPSQEVIPKKRNNPQYYKVIVNEFLLLIRTTRGLLAPKQLTDFLMESKKMGIFSPHFLSIYNYILVERTATRQRIIEDLQLTESYVYGIIKKLVKMEYIKKAGKVKGHLSGGHRPDLYAVLDVTPDEIAEARIKEERRNIPGYNLCNDLVQYLLVDFIPNSNTPKEITMTRIKREFKKNFDNPGYNTQAILEITARKIQAEGIEVWL